MRHILPSQVGYMRRLSRLFNPKSGKALFVPLDDLLIAGAPVSPLRSLSSILDEITAALPEAVIGFPGVLSELPFSPRCPSLILNLSASTKHGSHVRKARVFDVHTANQLDCDAVAFHLNISSQYEHEMISDAAEVIAASHNIGLPVLAIVYPRKEGVDELVDDNYETLQSTNFDEYVRLVEHCIYIAVELGADIIKTRCIQGEEYIERLVAAARGRPLVFAGGSQIPLEALLQMTSVIMKGGGSGVSFGRNVVNSASPVLALKALQLIIHEQESVKTALDFYRRNENVTKQI